MKKDTLDTKLKELTMRWFKNSPYPLPEWLTESFIKGLTDAQTQELKSLIKSTLLDALPKEVENKHEKWSGDKNSNEAFKDGMAYGYNQALSDIKDSLEGI